MPDSKGKVLVAMSGGVDSSVAAALLVRAGYEVVGCFMRLGSPGEDIDAGLTDPSPCPTDARIRIGHQGCCSINDAADARLVAAQLGIPFYVCNFKQDFGRIIDYFVSEYNAGRTPNPCVRCNDWLKFGRLHDYARQIGADWIASGHYARIEQRSGVPRLLRGLDHSKDQSYVLFGAPRHRLAEMMLPIGAYHKSRVRELAREMGLRVFDKPDSQEICFVPDNDYAGLVARKTPDQVHPGMVLDLEGRQVGSHPGHQHFTIGQRRGVGVALGYPIYVVSRDAQANTITVGPRERLMSVGCRAREVNWLEDAPAAHSDDWRACVVKIRYNADPVPGAVRALTADTIEVRFDAPQYAVAPGQAAVCYDAHEPDAVLCGGWIDAALSS